MGFTVIFNEIYYYQWRLSHLHDAVTQSILKGAAGRPQENSIARREDLRIGHAGFGKAQA